MRDILCRDHVEVNQDFACLKIVSISPGLWKEREHVEACGEAAAVFRPYSNVFDPTLYFKPRQEWNFGLPIRDHTGGLSSQ
jgi:hypothetical protein